MHTSNPTTTKINANTTAPHSLGDLGSLLVLRRLAELNGPASLGEVQGAQGLRDVVGRRAHVDKHHNLRVAAQGVLKGYRYVCVDNERTIFGFLRGHVKNYFV